jgi:ADP-heptose:LPS heptosyltransferase
MIDENPGLNVEKVTLVYTMYNHLGDFVVMGGLLKKFDLLGVTFESLVAHRGSPHVPLFNGKSQDRFFNVSSLPGFLQLLVKLRRQKKEGRVIFGIPMAPGSVQAFFFFWLLKKIGALTYIVDFNLINADVLTPPRRRYIFERHLAQAAEIFKRPEWMSDISMPLAITCGAATAGRMSKRIGFFPWSGRSHLAEFRWPDARWSELAKRILADPSCEIVLLGRDQDFARFAEVIRSQLAEDLRRRFFAVEAGSVPDLATSIRDVDCLITLNTSALHLAHAMKRPVVALCGSSAEVWRPEGEHVCVVGDSQGVLPPSDNLDHDPRQPSLQRIEVAEVYAAFTELHGRPAPR